VEVQVNGGRPSRFVWRGRLYTVLAVVERPREPATTTAAGGADVDAPEHDHRIEWRCWRVTASPAKNVPAVAFRLCHDPAADRWQLTRNGVS
jgi:Family of unknown function (DUF6504)